jgi:hypothetical protein
MKIKMFREAINCMVPYCVGRAEELKYKLELEEKGDYGTDITWRRPNDRGSTSRNTK